ncbi:MAG: MBL fold metallo-hydrolase [Cyanobacteria bacterium P01_A01_bin.116]
MIHAAHPSAIHPSNPGVSQIVSQDTQLSVKFWGVRGSVPTPIASNQRYGGNTACVEVQLGEQRIIFDAGTGLVELGQHLQAEGKPVDAHIFFTHTQWDRIQGFPFFQPAFTEGNRFSVYGGTAPNGASIKHCLTDQMLQPHFSMPLQHMRAQLTFQTLTANTRFNIGEVLVETICTNPVTQAFGYRLTWKDYTLVYATDTPTECVDSGLLAFVDQADLLIYDGTYSDLGYLHNTAAGEGLQPWEIGLDIVQKASIKELALLHHSPVQSDDILDQLQRDMRDRFKNTNVAYEGMVVSR